MQSVRLCKVTQQKKKTKEGKVMVDEDKRQMTSILDERINEVQRMTHN